MYSDLVISKSGWLAVRFTAVSLESAISEAFRIVPGPASQLEVLGLESGCFFQGRILSPRIQIMLLDLYQNIAEITHFPTVLASVLGTKTNLASFTRADNRDFQLPSNVIFCGYVHFETTLETNPNACNASAKNIEKTLQIDSPPLCVVSMCEPGQERRDCSSQDVGECVECPMGTYALQNMMSCSSCPLHSTSPLGSTQVNDC